MANTLSKLGKKSGSQHPHTSPDDIRQRIAKVRELNDDANDIARDHLRLRLPAYDLDDEESTARHDAPLPQRIIVENHTHLHSQPDLEPEAAPVTIPGWPHLTKALVAAAGLLASAIVAYVASKLSAH